MAHVTIDMYRMFSMSIEFKFRMYMYTTLAALVRRRVVSRRLVRGISPSRRRLRVRPKARAPGPIAIMKTFARRYRCFLSVLALRIQAISNAP